MSIEQVKELAASVAAEVASKTASDVLDDMTSNLRELKIQRRTLSLASLVDAEDACEVFELGAKSKETTLQRQKRLERIEATERELSLREKTANAKLAALRLQQRTVSENGLTLWDLNHLSGGTLAAPPSALGSAPPPNASLPGGILLKPIHTPGVPSAPPTAPEGPVIGTEGDDPLVHMVASNLRSSLGNITAEDLQNGASGVPEDVVSDPESGPAKRTRSVTGPPGSKLPSKVSLVFFSPFSNLCHCRSENRSVGSSPCPL